MDKRQDQQMMLKAARLYYEDSRTQDEVARVLKTSRPQVSRLLQQARQEGIVQIRIVDPHSTHSALERQLLDAFSLAEAIVVTAEDSALDVTRRRIGQATAAYLERTLQNGDTVGIGWGRTLYEVVSALEPRRKARVIVVPLIGGLGQVAPMFQVHELARMLADAFGGTQHNFYVPALVESDEMARNLMHSADVRQVAGLWERLDYALVGIGNVDFEGEIQMLFVNYLDENTKIRLLDAQAVGDICVRFFDRQGKPCPGAVHGVLGAELEQVRRARRVIGVAGGESKAEAILGALRGQYINVLVTDETAARRVLEMRGKSAE